MTTFITARYRSNIRSSFAGVWYVVGNSNQIRKSEDDGATWSIVTGPASGYALSDISGIDEDRIWVCAHNKTINYSSDGGSNWATQYTDAGGYRPTFIHMVSATEGYCVLVERALPFYYTSIRKWNGSAWNEVDAARADYIYCGGLYADVDGNIIVGGSSGRSGNTKQIRYSIDFGATWSDGSDDFNENVKGVYIHNGTWYMVVDSGVSKLYSTTDPLSFGSADYSDPTYYTHPIPLADGGNSLYTPDGVNFYWTQYHPSTGNDYFCKWNATDGITRYQFPGGTIYGPQSFFAASATNIKAACANDSVMSFNGSTVSRINIKAGGTSADYKGIWGY